MPCARSTRLPTYTHTHKLTELQRQTSLALPSHRLRVEWLEHDAYFWLCHRQNTHRLHIYAKEHQNYPGCRRRRHAITQFYFYLRHTNTNTHTHACPLVHYCGKTCVCKCTARNYTVAGDSFDCRRPATVSTLPSPSPLSRLLRLLLRFTQPKWMQVKINCCFSSFFIFVGLLINFKHFCSTRCCCCEVHDGQFLLLLFSRRVHWNWIISRPN